MLKVRQMVDIKQLKSEGLSVRQIVARTGHSRNTVRKVLRGEHSGRFAKPAKSSMLDPFKEHIRGRFAEYGLSAVRLAEEVRAMGFTGSVDTVRRFVKGLRGPAAASQKATVRFESPPGRQAQVDWAHCGRFAGPDGKLTSVYVFIMTMGYSRQMFVRFTSSMKLPVLIECHEKAFEFFGGWPQEILYDNMKQVRTSFAKYNDKFLAFAEHYGFLAKTCRPYRPRTKGKVERSVDYVKDNFLKGRTFEGFDDLNAGAIAWLNGTANVRIHGTTGRRPVDMFAEEKLTAWGTAKAFVSSDPALRRVSAESFVHFEKSRYSVPPCHVGRQVAVHSAGGRIIIHCGDLVIAEHAAATQAGQDVADREHVAELWRLARDRTPVPDHKTTWHLTLVQQVQQTPLSAYEEVAP